MELKIGIKTLYFLTMVKMVIDTKISHWKKLTKSIFGNVKMSQKIGKFLILSMGVCKLLIHDQL